MIYTTVQIFGVSIFYLLIILLKMPKIVIEKAYIFRKDTKRI